MFLLLTLAQHLLSRPQDTDMLLTAILDCIVPGNAVLYQLLELLIEPGCCSCHFSLQCLQLVLSFCHVPLRPQTEAANDTRAS